MTATVSELEGDTHNRIRIEVSSPKDFAVLYVSPAVARDLEDALARYHRGEVTVPPVLDSPQAPQGVA
tara:strand:- start:258 stop:461 length:204 start_codon:yes stop_codon:yes gene_type:complete